jgi:poly(A) polymerase
VDVYVLNESELLNVHSELNPLKAPEVIGRASHPISRKDISPAALKVLYRLNEAGYQAFLVGGGIRDLLLGLHPKDFDVATNATPDQVRSLFRNCRLIGRRFRLAHVMFGPETIEVATFRGNEMPNTEDNALEQRHMDAAGRLLKDNIYGTIEQDVWRRDFTCNALYYNIADFSIWDYAGGWADIDARILRLIGDPAVRYREDPVRMLRAARFAAKLGFTLEPQTAAPIAELGALLANVPPARLFDEVLKLMLSGYGERSLQVLMDYRLLEPLLPPVAAFLAQAPLDPYARLLRLGLASTDARVMDDKPVSPVFLFLVMLMGPIAQRMSRYQNEGSPWARAAERALDESLRDLLVRVGVPKRFTLPLREVWGLVARLKRLDGKRVQANLTHPRFRMAYDILELESLVGLVEPKTVDFWRQLQLLEGEERLEYLKARQAEWSSSAEESIGSPDKGDSGSMKPRRRRRRRGPKRSTEA